MTTGKEDGQTGGAPFGRLPRLHRSQEGAHRHRGRSGSSKALVPAITAAARTHHNAIDIQHEHTAAATAAHTAATDAAIRAFDFSPGTASKMRAIAAASAAAAAAAASASVSAIGDCLDALSQSAGSSSERKAAPAAAGKQRMKPAHRGAGVAPLPPAVRGSALVVVPSVSYGAGKDYYTVSVKTFLLLRAIFASKIQCSQCWFRGLLGAYITCQSSNALLTTYSVSAFMGVAALDRIPR